MWLEWQQDSYIPPEGGRRFPPRLGIRCETLLMKNSRDQGLRYASKGGGGRDKGMGFSNEPLGWIVRLRVVIEHLERG